MPHRLLLSLAASALCLSAACCCAGPARARCVNFAAAGVPFFACTRESGGFLVSAGAQHSVLASPVEGQEPPAFAWSMAYRKGVRVGPWAPAMDFALALRRGALGLFGDGLAAVFCAAAPVPVSFPAGSSRPQSCGEWMTLIDGAGAPVAAAEPRGDDRAPAGRDGSGTATSSAGFPRSGRAGFDAYAVVHELAAIGGAAGSGDVDEYAGVTRGTSGGTAFDGMAVRCLRHRVSVAGRSALAGSCVLSDGNGDEVFATVEGGTFALAGGTGKYRGLSGHGTVTADRPRGAKSVGVLVIHHELSWEAE